jgi:ParB-like chromosome segregation protein Spo0J
MSDLATCRICGCTEDQACEGGCFWVEDPEHLGDLCSKCLPKLAGGGHALDSDRHVWEISLEQIRPAPWNPPSRMDPERVEDLADSIKIEGQQSPALLRPVEAEPPVRYELVWGHRRFAALNLINKSIANDAAPSPPYPTQEFLPLKAFIREMTEEQAMISSGIENLQREGFSDIEEAEFFRTASERYGESAVKILSEKLSVSGRYVRKRIEILKLPAAALDLWRAGTWHVGHMEQLLRLGEEVLPFLDKIDQRRRPELRVWELQDMIGRRALPLHSGNFDKTECKSCQKNSDCQHRLFGLEKGNGARCLDQKCFIGKQEAWFTLHWPTAKANKYGTQAAVIGDYETKTTGEFSQWGTKPGDKCRSCPHFTTIISTHNQKLHPLRATACLGPAACFAETGKSAKAPKKNSQAKQDPEAPRVGWHGEFFRHQYYQQEIPRLMAELSADDPRRLQVAVAMLVHSSRDSHEWFWQKLGLEVPTHKNSWEYFHPSFYQILQAVKGFNALQTELLLAEVLVKIALQPGRGYETSLADRDRQALAEFLDIDWAGFAITADYLEKKTKAEIIRFIAHDSGLGEVPTFLEAMQSRGFATVEKLAAAKKPALVELLLQCGVDLHGRLPKEIADRPKLENK